MQIEVRSIQMRSIIIRGGKRLQGKVRCDGAKNAALPVLAGAILSHGKTTISNVPRLTDIDTMIEVLQSVGVRVKSSGEKVQIDASGPLFGEAPYELVRKMRASFLVAGPLLVRLGHIAIPLPGGCAIGQRPVDLHLKGFAAMGAEIYFSGGCVHAKAERLRGATIYLDVPSVGATENIMMAATLADGETVIENAAQEPEIVDLAMFLNSLGADIRGAGTPRVRITGAKELRESDYSVIPDRIEAATFLVAGAITQGTVTVENVIPAHLNAVIAKLKEAGCTVIQGTRWVEVRATDRPLPLTIKTLPYPGFPTDAQAPFTSLCSVAKGTSIISETVFENRFGHVEELRRMGANIRIEGSNAIIEGVSSLTGALVQATDLRAGAALCLAGLAAQGVTQVTGLEHIERGYAGFARKLWSLGASISMGDCPEKAKEVSEA